MDNNRRYSDALRGPQSSHNRKPPIIEEIVGNLFEHSTTSNIVHCVGMDLQMRRGFANLVRKQFGRVDYLRSQRKQVGDVAVLPEGSRYIFYLITKQSTSDYMPSLDDIRSCLQTLRTLCDDYKLKELSMPRICSGLDHIPWFTVKSIISEVFAGSKIKIKVYRLPKPGPIPQTNSSGPHSTPQSKPAVTTTTKEEKNPLTTNPTTTTTSVPPITQTVNSTNQASTPSIQTPITTKNVTLTTPICSTTTKPPSDTNSKSTTNNPSYQDAPIVSSDLTQLKTPSTKSITSVLSSLQPEFYTPIRPNQEVADATPPPPNCDMLDTSNDVCIIPGPSNNLTTQTPPSSNQTSPIMSSIKKAFRAPFLSKASTTPQT
ncbi:hypothetical protein B566_EDAN018657 [Ephemera danica]|nr:hypothetical protein B566_EDAN018657 [Ephemera danica]